MRIPYRVARVALETSRNMFLDQNPEGFWIDGFQVICSGIRGSLLNFGFPSKHRLTRSHCYTLGGWWAQFYRGCVALPPQMVVDAKPPYIKVNYMGPPARGIRLNFHIAIDE